MASEKKESDDALGVEDMDPDDPNYQYKDMILEVQKLANELPPGWSRNTTDLSKAPFLHEDGRTAYKNPNREKIDQLVKDMKAAEDKKNETEEKKQDKDNALSPNELRQIKKLRLMIKRGLPLGAVEQQARLANIDMALVLQEETGPDPGPGPDPSKHDEKKSQRSPSSPLVSKYKRMLKRGVSLPAVQQLAFAEGGWTPEQVEKECQDVLAGQKINRDESYVPLRKTKEKKKDVDVDVKKYRLMLKSGISMDAVLQAATADGVADTDSLKMTLLTTDDEPKHFVPTDEGLLFQNDKPLAALVRKMAHTIQKRAAATTKGATMTVSANVLYHALGALQGVQNARDRFNETTTKPEGNCQEARVKRQAFCEIARAISMELPTTTTTPVDIDGLDELVDYISQTFRKELDAIQAQLDEGVYDFDSLTLLYPPGSKVVAKNAGGGGVDMMCRVAWNRYEEGKTIMGQRMKYFKVCFQYVVAVGSSHATIAEVVEGMESFEGRRSILGSLTFVPFRAYTKDQQEGLAERYHRRGELYNRVALHGKHIFMEYQKGCFFMKRGGSALASSVAGLATGGRIVIDTQGAYDHGHSLGVGYDPMVLGIKYKYKEYNLHLRSLQQDKPGRNSDFDDGGLILFDQVPEDYLGMVWPCVVGFSLSAKAWGDVLVDGLEDICWQEDIFDRLVLPEKRKRMVKALVRHSSDTFQDLVQGKGEGTVFLMYGPPGVGKTLTAEAVAELLHKPLYSLSMGTLGSNPAELEQRLGQIMNLSAKWDALILLDEADAFLETRSSNSSLDRNAMVSVMLKLVEYFTGILFLTSNRIDSLDPAFQTRITLALRYEQLDASARQQVWKNLLVRSGFDDYLQDGRIVPAQLAVPVLNGREIKNALRLAMAMAAEDGKPLSQNILLDTVDVVNDYKATMNNPNYIVYGQEQQQEKKKWFCW